MKGFALGTLAGVLVTISACSSGGSHSTAGAKNSTTSVSSALASSFSPPAPASCPNVQPSGSPSSPPPTAPSPEGTLLASIPAPRSPQDVTTGDGSVWVVTHRTLDVWRIDPSTNHAVDIPYQTNHGDAQVFAISAGPDGVFGVVGLDDVVDRIDPAANKLVALAHIQGVTAVADTPVGLWVGIRGGQGRAPVDALVQIDPSSGNELHRVAVGNGGRLLGVGLSVTYATGSLWVRTDENDTLVRVDPQAAKVVASVKLPSQPVQLAANPAGLYASVDPGAASSTGSLQVVRIDPQSNCPGAIADFGNAGDGTIFLAASTDAVYASYGKGAFAVLDPQSLAVRKAIRFDDQQYDGGLAVDFGSVWYTTFDKDTVLRLRP